MTAELNVTWDGKPVPFSRIIYQLRMGEGFSLRQIDVFRHYMVAAPPDYRGIPAGVWFDVWLAEGETIGVHRVNDNWIHTYVRTRHPDGIPCGPVTMLLRVLAAMRGEPIDESVDEDRPAGPENPQVPGPPADEEGEGRTK